MDGRVQSAVSDWIKQNYPIDYVDTITAPGADRRVAEQTDLAPIIEMARISIQKHNSRLIVVSGHYDCAGNPVSDAEHKDHIKKATNVIKTWEDKYDLLDMSEKKGGLDCIKVVGVWVGDNWTAQKITKEEEEEKGNG